MKSKSMKGWRPSAVLAWISSLGALLSLGASLGLGRQLRAEEALFDRSVETALVVLFLRVLHGVALLFLQVRAVEYTRRSARGDSATRPFVLGEEELKGSKKDGFKLYLLLSFWLGLAWVLFVLEVLIGISLVLIAGFVETLKLDSGVTGLFVVSVVLVWVAIGLRALTSSLPLKWTFEFGMDYQLWFVHHRSRYSGLLRWFFCFCCCDHSYMCGPLARDPVLPTQFEQDQLTGVATMLAFVLQFRAKGLLLFEVIGILSELFHDQVKTDRKEAALAREKAEKEGYSAMKRLKHQLPDKDVSRETRELLEKALELNKFAIGVYTGKLLDMERLWCCGIGLWCLSQQLLCPCFDRFSAHKKVVHDNCANGHRLKFLDYLNEEVVLVSGNVGFKACRTTYQLVKRRAFRTGKEELVLALRGTEDVYDMVTDAIMWPSELKKAELGLPAGANIHLGVLLCVRALIDEVALEIEAVSVIDSPVHVWVVGHSLGGACATLSTVALKERLSQDKFIVRAFAYQPLPSVDLETSQMIRSRHGSDILSLPFGDDIVSRLSLQRLASLTSTIENIRTLQRNRNRIEKARGVVSHFIHAVRFGLFVPFSCLWKGRRQIHQSENEWYRARQPVWNDLADRSSSGSEEWDPSALVAAAEGGEELERLHGESYSFPRLFLAGEIIYIRKERKLDGFRAFKAHCGLEATDLRFEQIILSKDMFIDHVPWRLQVAVAEVLGKKFVNHANAKEKEMGKQNSKGASAIELV